MGKNVALKKGISVARIAGRTAPNASARVQRKLEKKKRFAEKTARLSAVVNNSVFRTNPLAAIATHLEATLPAPPPAPRNQLTKAQKRKARKASAQSNVMQ
ncbi:hypothetical protein QBZ16_003546 [Prototheca wickerhamii]|uniref:Uncharacterized protein n=1 Tax=Prototheca wickerhamii TaxID=3111 RepID=A0AAD9MNG1_PROWI|nr:hypothetical protein QBZ16_003546 [Prototheca wickerhamii]